MKTQSMLRISLSIALIAIGARLQLPSPTAGYFTLQLPMVLITAIILNRQAAVSTILIYILGGLIGIPWFASGGGIGYLLQPTFGFILAFIPAVYIMQGQSNLWVRAILATILIWLIGMTYYYGISVYYLGKEATFIPMILSIFSLDLFIDIILATVSVLIGRRVSTVLEAS